MVSKSVVTQDCLVDAHRLEQTMQGVLLEERYERRLTGVDHRAFARQAAGLVDEATVGERLGEVALRDARAALSARRKLTAEQFQRLIGPLRQAAF